MGQILSSPSWSVRDEATWAFYQQIKGSSSSPRVSGREMALDRTVHGCAGCDDCCARYVYGGCRHDGYWSGAGSLVERCVEVIATGLVGGGSGMGTTTVHVSRTKYARAHDGNACIDTDEGNCVGTHDGNCVATNEGTHEGTHGALDHHGRGRPAPVFDLRVLPPELVQLVVDVVVGIGGTEVLCSPRVLASLQYASFYSLVLDDAGFGRGKGGHVPSLTTHREKWNPLFPTETLERLVVSGGVGRVPTALGRGRWRASWKCSGYDDGFLLRYAPGCLKLRFLCLSHCDGVRGVSVGALLRGLPRLEEVCVVHCRGVGDVCGGCDGERGSRGVLGEGGSRGVLSPALWRLNVESCLGLRGLGALLGATLGDRLQNLRVLNLGRCRLLKNVDAVHVSRLSNLRWLDVSYTGITDAGVAALGELRGLEFLSVAGVRAVDSSVAHAVRCMDGLKELNVSRAGLVGNATLIALAAHRPSRLRVLHASFTSVTNTGLMVALPGLDALEHVDFDSCRVDEGLVGLQGCGGLVEVRIGDTLAGNDVAEALSHLGRLERLDISFTPMVNDIGLRYVSKIRTLRSLVMSTADVIAEDGLRQLEKLPRLHSLDLSGCRVSDAHCVVLSKIGTLRRLDVTGGEMTCRGIEHLSKLRQLWRLSLAHARYVGDDSSPFLVQMDGLVKLNVSGCALSDKAIKMLSAGLKKLKVLSIADRILGRELVVELVHMNANLEIVGLKN